MNRASSGSSDYQSTPVKATHASRSRPLPSNKPMRGFAITKVAEGLSPRTVASWVEYLSR
jgi:hypothetical protein